MTGVTQGVDSRASPYLRAEDPVQPSSGDLRWAITLSGEPNVGA